MSVKYVWCEKLYLGEKAAKKSKKLISKVEKGKLLTDAYLVTLPIAKTKDLLEIYRSLEFKQKHYDGAKVYVVGLARGKDEAVDLVMNIINDTYTENDDLDIRRFLGFYEEEN